MLPSLRNLLARLHAAHLPSALNRLLLYSTTSPSASPFAAENYLVASCGLTPAQARRCSKYLAHVKYPDNSDAVRAFLADLGLSKSDLAAAIHKFPRLLCSRVDQTLAPRVAEIRGVGLSLPEISRLVTVSPTILMNPCRIPRLAFFLSFFGSFDKLHTALRINAYILSKNLELVVKPNIAFLQQCGLRSSDTTVWARLVCWDLERVKEVVTRAEELVPRNTGMFKYALMVAICLSPSRINAKLNFLKTLLGCSEADLAIAVRKSPDILRNSEKKLGRAVDFLKREIGLETQYIVHRPALLNYSMDRRVMPRHYVINILKAKGLLGEDIDIYYVFAQSEERFSKKFLANCKDTVPELMDAYAAACKRPQSTNTYLRRLFAI